MSLARRKAFAHGSVYRSVIGLLLILILSFNVVIKRCISHYFSNGADTRVPQNVFLVIRPITILLHSTGTQKIFHNIMELFQYCSNRCKVYTRKLTCFTSATCIGKLKDGHNSFTHADERRGSKAFICACQGLCVCLFVCTIVPKCLKLLYTLPQG